MSNKRGITLIALIVTIIVLLILAGVSIAVLTGENGILNRATEAKQTNEQKTAEEELKLGIVSLSTDYYSKTTRPSTFREFIFTEESEADLNKYLSGTATFNSTNYTITYKNVTYQVAENGNLSIAEGIVLLDKLTLISGVDASYQLTADQKNIEAPSLSWTSSDTSVATVGSTTGLVTVVGQGKTTITVSGTYNNKNYSAECEVTVAELVVSLEENKEIVINGSEQVSLTITPASVASRDDISVNWTSTAISPNTWVATFSSTTGVSTNVGVPQGTTANTTAKITATVKKGEATLATKDCTIKAITSPWIDSSYVQYNVAYTDVYTGTQYTANTGWRLLTDVSGSEYTGNIEIISTGIPAKLYYHYDSITGVAIEEDLTGTITKGKWAGNSTQRSNFVNSFYGNASYENVYAASGLFYNFGNIIFDVVGETLSTSTLTKEKGGYRAISNNGSAVLQSSTTTGDDLFRATVASGTVTGVRSVNLKDIKNSTADSTEAITTANDKRTGLFKLNDYTPVPEYASTGSYWLASPGGGNGYSLRYVAYSGGISGSDSYPYGVRPVVSITGVKMQKNGNVWQIVANSNS